MKSEIHYKYVKLLNEAFEKYKDVEVIRIVNPCNKPSSASPESFSRIFVPEIRKSVSECGIKNRKNLPKKIENNSTGKDVREKTSKRDYHHKVNSKLRRTFSVKEDHFLLKFLDNNPDFSVNKKAKIRQITHIMGRSLKSIEKRISMLQKGITSSRRKRKQPFTLAEDKLIIDKAIEQLKSSGSLKHTTLYHVFDLSVPLNRSDIGVSQRWNIHIRTWLLQYYKKCLNLDVRSMLCNFLLENNFNLDKIDWKVVLESFEDFGHTEESLRYVFYQLILKYASMKLEKPRYDLTLTEIAEFYKTDNHSKPISSALFTRQMELIRYFEHEIDLHGFKDFV